MLSVRSVQICMSLRNESYYTTASTYAGMKAARASITTAKGKTVSLNPDSDNTEGLASFILA